SPRPSRSWPPRVSAPAASNWARRSSRSAWRIRCGWPRISRRSTSCRGGRINPGVSVGTPMLYDHYKTKLYPETHELENLSKDRVVRLLDCLRGDPVSDFDGKVGIEDFTRNVQPHSSGLASRVWYGGGLSSA